METAEPLWRNIQPVQCQKCGRDCYRRTWFPAREAWLCDTCHPTPRCRFR